MMISRRFLIALIAVLITFSWTSIRFLSHKNSFDSLSFIKLMKLNDLKSDLNMARDFLRYKCNDMRRVGGFDGMIQKVSSLYRIDGAWFVCFDQGLKFIENECTVLSFGINRDYTFDQQMNKIYKCQVESFDPYYEAEIFKNLRSKSAKNANEVTLSVNDSPLWRFHRIGIVSLKERSKDKTQIGWMATFDEILKYTQLENKVIDIFKMDIEGVEDNILNTIDVNYLCKYVKQLYLENHVKDYKTQSSLRFIRPLQKLESCFLLFKRDTRFFIETGRDQYGNAKTEFQDPKYKIDLNYFDDEIDLINYVVTHGELYFININYL